MSDKSDKSDKKSASTLEWIKYISSVVMFVLGLLLASSWFQNYNALNILAEHLKSLSPGLDIHYTNMVHDVNSGKVEMKVYVKNISDHDVFLPTPCVYFSDYNKDLNQRTELQGEDLPFGCAGKWVPPNPEPLDMSKVNYGFGSMLSPGADLCIQFELSFPKDDDGQMKPGRAIGLAMVASTVDAYVDTLHLAVNNLPESCEMENGKEVCIKKKLKGSLDSNRFKSYSYLEKINTEYGVAPYGLGETEYKNFCSNPQ